MKKKGTPTQIYLWKIIKNVFQSSRRGEIRHHFSAPLFIYGVLLYPLSFILHTLVDLSHQTQNHLTYSYFF